MTTFTIEEAQRELPIAVEKALRGEEVLIAFGDQTLHLVRGIPWRPPGFFAECYRDSEDAAFEERICRDSKPALDA